MDKLYSALAEFAAKLGIEVTRLWPEVVRVHFIRSLVDAILWPPVLIVAGIVAFRLLLRGRTILNSDYDHDGEGIAYSLGGGIALAVVVAMSFVYCIGFASTVSAIISPEADLVLKTIQGNAK